MLMLHMKGIAQEYKKRGINTLLFGTNSCSLYKGIGIWYFFRIFKYLYRKISRILSIYRKN